MKKNVIALAVAAAVAAPVAAMADTTLYGQAKISYDFFQHADNSHGMSSNGSRIGVKGSEQISAGLTAIYQMEFSVDMTDNPAGSVLGARNTFVGLTGGWGTVIGGRHDTPMKALRVKTDMFADRVGSSVNAIGYDNRTPNTIAYVTPNFSGFQATLAYVSDRTPNTLNKDFDDNDNSAVSVNALYENAGLMFGAAYDQYSVKGESNPYQWRLIAGYTFGGAKIVGLYQDGGKQGEPAIQQVWGLGASYTMGQHVIKGQFYDQRKASKGQLFAVGYDFNMSKQTTVYAAYAHGKDGIDPAKSTRGNTGNWDNDDKAGVFSVGVEHRF